jgi:uncharacterized repeat protein (TIGR01451 family)
MNVNTLRRWSCLFALLVAFSGVPLLAQEGTDLTVTKSGPAAAPAGANVAYSVTVTNLGPDDAVSVTLNDAIPAGMTFVSHAQETGPFFTCSTPAVGSGGSISCTINTFAAGSSADFTFVLQIPPAAPPGTLFVNVATVTTDTLEVNDENNSSAATTSTPPPPEADMAIVKTGPVSAGPGTDVTYTIDVSNFGPDAAVNVSWQDTLPGTLTFVSLVRDSGPVMTCTTPAVGAGGTIICNAATFPAGATASFTLTGHIPADTQSGTIFTNNVSVAAETGDPNFENNDSTTSLSVSSVDVSVVKTGPASAMAGTTVNYVLTVANAGPDIAENVVLSDVLPPGTTFVSVTPNSSPAPVCDGPIPGMGGTVTCTFPLLGAGASAQITLAINTGSATSYTNTATVTTDSFDTDGTDNSSSVSTAVTQSADLSVVKTGPATVAAGSSVTYTVTVTNQGPSNAAGVSLSDAVPASTTFLSATQTSGPAFNCVKPAVGAGGTITCSIATLPAGATATFSFVFQVSPAAVGSISNTASLTSGTTDPTPGNNASTASVTVTAPAPVAIPTLSSALLVLLGLALGMAGLWRLRRDGTLSRR